MNHLGKYLHMPATFEKLKQLDTVLATEGFSLDRDLSLIVQHDFLAYDVTPYDVITFASTGCDGVHFGLLTDFGTVEDLENAFVVSISPMEFGSYTKIVARNITEFVSLICTVKGSVSLANFHHFKNEEQYLNFLKKLEQEERENLEYATRTNFVVKKTLSTFGCGLIENVYDYVERIVKKAREQQIVLPTLDGIGVKAMGNAAGNHTIYTLSEDTHINLNEVKSFFKTATTESKLAFIRDAQFNFLLAGEIGLKKLVIEELMRLGLEDERLQR